MILPTFQPQNPDINGYYLGWSSCTAYSGAMAAAFERQRKAVMSGEALRRKTGDTSGGTNLAQIDSALIRGWNINLEVYYRMSWATFERLIREGMGAVLQGWYAPIADSQYDAGRGFRANHAVFVPPTWGVMDPLADGRYGQAYKYVGAPYPRSLLKEFAGKLNLATSGYRQLGSGLVYAALTIDNTRSYQLRFEGGAFWTYKLGPDGNIRKGSAGRQAKRFSGPSVSRCGPPFTAKWFTNGRWTSRKLVQVTNTGSTLYGEYVGVPQGTVNLEVL